LHAAGGTERASPLTKRLEASGIGLLTYHYAQFLSERPDAVLDDPRNFFAGRAA
jgi:hypothetical protein